MKCTSELWMTMNDYLEVNVREIKSSQLTMTKMIEPFKIDMKLADLSDLMTIYSNFAFNFHHEAYDVELMEEDMNIDHWLLLIMAVLQCYF